EPQSPSYSASVPPLPAPRKVLWWLIGDQEDLDVEQKAFTTRLFDLCPQVSIAAERVSEFFTLARERNGDALADWVERTEQSGCAELRHFCSGVRADWNAVLAGLKLPWSNGPTEG